MTTCGRAGALQEGEAPGDLAIDRRGTLRSVQLVERVRRGDRAPGCAGRLPGAAWPDRAGRADVAGLPGPSALAIVP